jgi:type IV pilus assembly protein PilA
MVSPRLSRFVRRPRSCAFTLIELLVVVVILAILLAVAIPAYLSQQTKAKDAKAKQYLAYAYRAIRSGIPETNNKFPTNTSMVSWVQQSEPELTSAVGNCYALGTLTSNSVVVDSGSSSGNLTLCTRSDSGNVWKLTATPTSAATFTDATVVPLAVSGNEITDATRANTTKGDGLSNDSSTGIWDGTTNFVTNGGLETNATGWIAMNADASVARDMSTAKFGSASLKVTSSAGDNAGAAFTNNGIPVSGSTIYTASAWVKVPTGTLMTIQIESGTFPSSQFTGTGSWQRVQVTGTTSAGATFTDFKIMPANNAASTFSWWIDGAQFEQKSLATPYVETNGATASRAVADVRAPTALLNSTQGWVAARVRIELSPSVDSAFTVFGWGSALNSADLGMGWRSVVGPGVHRNGTQTYINATVPVGTVVTLIMDWTGNQVGISLNGGIFSTASIPATNVTPTAFQIGAELGRATKAGSDILWLATGNGTLSNADAATINGFGNNDPQASSFPSTAQATFVWDGVGSTGSLK